MPNTLTEWLNELGRRHPPQIIQLGLDRPKRAMQRLAIAQPDPQHTTLVTIAGTNGKGSVAMLLAQLLQLAGISVGLYTSPHLYDFGERLQIDGKQVDEDAWVAAFHQIDAKCGDMQLTYFEWVTLAAFLLLQQHRPRVWVLEIGLGGRLDIVNALDNQLNVITSIDYDHTDRLGNSLEAIATEKAGVMRSGVTSLCGSTLACFRQLAAEKGADLQVCGHEWSYHIQQRVQRQETAGRIPDQEQHQSQSNQLKQLELSIGDWQTIAPIPAGILPTNTALAVAAAHCLAQQQGLDGLDSSLSQLDWLAEVELPGRQQQLTIGGVDCLLDVAHNAAGIAQLAERVAREFFGVPMLAVFACLADKQPPTGLAELFPNVHSWLLADLQGARSQSAEAVRKQINLPEAKLLRDYSPSQVRALVGEGGMLLAFGSFHVPPVVRQLLA